MHFTVKQKTLMEALKMVSRVSPRTTSMPVLEGILLEAKNGTLKLTATDMEMGIEGSISAQIREEGRTVLPESYFTGLVRELPDLDIEVRVDSPESRTAFLNCSNSRYRIGCLNADDFPRLPQVEGRKLMLKQGLIRRLVQQSEFAISGDETRPYLTGALVEIDGDQITMVATDTRRLTYSTNNYARDFTDGGVEGEGDEPGEREQESEGPRDTPQGTEGDGGGVDGLGEGVGRENVDEMSSGGGDETRGEGGDDGPRFSVIIPGKTLKELNRLVGEEGEEENLTLVLSDKQLRFEVGGVSVFSRLIDGQFPNYRQFFPDSFRTSITFDRGEMTAAARRCQMIARKSRLVIFNVEGDLLRVEAESEEGDEGNEKLEVGFSGEPLRIGFNASYLLDFLRVVEEEKIEMSITDEDGPAVLAPAGRDNYSYILMPVRLG